jgi:hypothetical protein
MRLARRAESPAARCSRRSIEGSLAISRSNSKGCHNDPERLIILTTTHELVGASAPRVEFIPEAACMKTVCQLGQAVMMVVLVTTVGVTAAGAQTVPQNCLEPPHFSANSLVGMDFTTVQPNPGHLFGFVLPSSDRISSDGDWNIEINPDAPPPGFESNVGLNTAEDFRRHNIECEICSKCTTLLNNRLPIEGDQVQLDGIHVLDNGHDSKTEIHPITGMQILEIGPSRPRPGEEIFHLVVGVGGSCPEGVLRAASPNAQLADELITLPWPAPPPSATSFFKPAFDITELTNGTPQPILVDFGGGPTNRIQIARDETLMGTVGTDRFPITVTRTGSAVFMALHLLASSGTLSFDTHGRVFDVHTTWDNPTNVRVVVDNVTDQHIVLGSASHPFRVRRYQVNAHIDPTLADISWFLHSGATGYSTPGPQLLGRGANLQFNYDRAPANQLGTYSFTIEAQGPNGLSVFSSPIHLPHPSIGIKEVADSETCRPIDAGGRQERHVAITLAADAANFASGPNITWALAPDPLQVGQQSLSFTGPQITHEFVISPASPQNRFTVRVTASDLDNVESASTEGDEELLYFQPMATLICQPLAFPRWRLSALTSGTCGTLHRRWYTGENAEHIDISNPSVDPIQVQVNITDDAGQEINLLANGCGNAYIEQQRLRLLTSVDLLGKLLVAHQLISIPEPPGPPSPETTYPAQMWAIAKSMAITAQQAPPEIIAQRTGFIGGLLSALKKALPSEQRDVLQKLAEQHVREVWSGRYVESSRSSVVIPATEWSGENAREADARAKEMISHLRDKGSR